MTNNLVDATLVPADREAVLAAIATIRQKLPFLIDLTTGQRRRLTKFGDKSRAFVQKALEIAIQNPSALPGSFSVEELKRDVQLYEDLQSILMALRKLLDLVEDTAMEVGSQAYAGARTVYSYVKVSGAREALEVAAEDLGRRFGRKSGSGSSTPAPESTTPKAKR